MEKYNKESIKKSLQVIRADIKRLESAIPAGASACDYPAGIGAFKEKERLLRLELAVAELQEKIT